MKRVDLKLSLPVVAPLLDVLRAVADDLKGSLAAPLRMPDLDVDFREILREELLLGQNKEIATFLGIFDDEFYATGQISVDEENALAVVRAATALRLQLRHTRLRQVGDEALEGGMVNPDGMAEGPKQALLTYVFLATLQELILKHLGASLLQGPPAETEPDEE